MLIPSNIFRFELKLNKNNTSLIENLDRKVLNLLSLVIILMLPYTHPLMTLLIHLSPNIIYGHVLFLFCEFIARETPILTLRRHHLKIHIVEVYIVSTLIEIHILDNELH